MAQKHNSYEEKPMTRYGTVQGPSRRYRRLRNPTFPATEWTAKNPLLQRGEIGYEVDTHHVKVGDGLTYWNDLPYIFDDAGQPLSTADYQMGNAQGGWTTMSQAQQDALNSGATTTKIGQIATNTTTIGNHIADTNNPHSVTKTQVGLGNVDNTSDLDKPISTATQNALDLKANTADLGTAAYTDSSDYATSAQGAKADTALQPGDNVSELVNDAGYLTQHQTLADLGITATAAEINVLDGITASTTELNYVDGVTSSIQTQITTNKNTMDGHIANTSNPHSVTKSQVGLGNCDNTSDLNKPISTATQTALNAKQDVLTAGSNITISGNTISATDTTYTASDGITLTGTNFTNSGVRSVASGTANGTIAVNTNGTTADVAVTGLGSAAYTASTDYATSAQGTKADTAVQPGDLATVATSGSYDDLLNKPTIPAAQVNSDWDAVSGVAQILNKPTLGTMAAESANDYTPTSGLATVATTGNYSDLSGTPSLATVATSGSYTDLSNKPTIPTVNNATLTIQKNSTNVATFTANASSNVTADISVPTKVSDLSNDSGFITGITSSDVTTALGYTPYNSSNPNGYTSNVGTVTSVNNTSPDGSGNVSLTIPTVNDGTINVTQNGVSVGSFTMNQASSDTIALTDTTYSVMTGASAGDAGTNGLVPAPAAGDQGKFLQGDGTWANPTAATAWGNITGTLSDQTDLQSALSGKADTATTLAGYGITDGANTSLSNLTVAGNNFCAHAGLPGTTYNNLTLGADGSVYLAPADGYFCLSASSFGVDGVVFMYRSSPRYGLSTRYTPYDWVDICLPISKGEYVTIQYTGTPTVQFFRFLYANSAS